MPLWVGLFLAVLFFLVAHGEAVSCEVSLNGTTYNLNPLTYDPNEAEPSETGVNLYSFANYFINFCEEVSTVSYYDCSKNSPAASCQLSGGTYYSCGTVASTSFMYYQGLLTFVK